MIKKKEILHYFLTAFLYGAGFGVPFWGLLIASDNLTKTLYPFDHQGIVVVSHDMIYRGSSVAVLGTLKNEGKHYFDSIRVYVNLYDSKGRFKEQCRKYHLSYIHPGKTRKFLVICEGDEKNPIPSFERYEIKIR